MDFANFPSSIVGASCSLCIIPGTRGGKKKGPMMVQNISVVKSSINDRGGAAGWYGSDEKERREREAREIVTAY